MCAIASVGVFNGDQSNVGEELSDVGGSSVPIAALSCVQVFTRAVEAVVAERVKVELTLKVR